MEKRIRDQVDYVGNNKPHILEWAKARRPDVARDLQTLLNREDLMFIAAIAYAAGRTSVVAELEKTTIAEVLKE